MQILNIYMSYYPVQGGIQKVIQEISEYFVQGGHDAKVICFTDKEMSSLEVVNGVEVHRIKDDILKYCWGYSFAFPEFFRKNQHLFDDSEIINIHSYHTLMSWQIIKFLRNQGYENKIVFTPHYEGLGFSHIKNILHKLYRCIASSSFTIPKKIICVSNYEKTKLQSNFNISDQKIQVIPNGVEYNLPNEKYTKIISTDTIRILYVGRIREYKGIQHILRAIKYIIDNYSYNIEFNVVGTGDYLKTLKKITVDYDLHCVNYLGHVDCNELNKLYQKSDFFILPSKSECYGIVVAEALANGLITIVSRKTALIEFISENGCFGIDYPPNHIELAELICKLMNEPVAIGPFSKKISRWTNVAEKYLDVYTEVITNDE